jgi:hypothetical protein
VEDKTTILQNHQTIVSFLGYRRLINWRFFTQKAINQTTNLLNNQTTKELFFEILRATARLLGEGCWVIGVGG